MTFEYTLGKTLLKATDLKLKLGGRQILDGVSLEVKDIRRPGLTQGQVASLLGPSGIGKTQTFRILAGLNGPDSGEVLVTENQVPVEAGMVGVVMQHYPLLKYYTVLGNLMFAAMKSGKMKSKAEAKDKSMELLKRFGLADHAGHWPKDLSGGQRQRVAIAQQLLCSEQLLLMDEPFSGLDPKVKDDTCRLIQEVAASDDLLTIVVVTHDISSAVMISDHIWCMGRDRDANGEVTSGAKIIKTIDVIEREITWHPNNERTPQFTECANEIRSLFATL